MKCVLYVSYIVSFTENLPQTISYMRLVGETLADNNDILTALTARQPN